MVGREQYTKDVIAGKLLNMMTIIHENRDLSLFKYTPSLEHCMDMIINERVYLSSASRFNDPFDSLPAYERIKHYGQEDKWLVAYKNIALHQKALELQKTIKVACFSEKIDSSIMWSHYADSHQGFCLEYKISDIIHEKTDILLPVLYSEERIFDGECELEEYREFMNRIRSVIYKEEDWDYEKEWRFIIKDNDEQKERYISNVKPRALYIGLKNDSIRANILVELAGYCKENGVCLYQMVSNSDTYKMEPIKIV